jgi:hypothetical protein
MGRIAHCHLIYTFRIERDGYGVCGGETRPHLPAPLCITYSLAKLREKRAEASDAMVVLKAPQFEQLGVRLESVSIGALE